MELYILDHDKDKRNDYMSSLKTIVEKHCVQDEKLKNVTNTVKELIGNLKSDSNPEEIMQMFKVIEIYLLFILYFLLHTLFK